MSMYKIMYLKINKKHGISKNYHKSAISFNLWKKKVVKWSDDFRIYIYIPKYLYIKEKMF